QVEQHLKSLGLPLTAEQAKSLLFTDDSPQIFDSLKCHLGCSGTITLPYFADELTTIPTEILCGKISEAAEIAIDYGASSISLAGMLPSLTDYSFGLTTGNELSTAQFTTGHSVTVVAVVKNVAHAIERSGLDIEDLTIAFLGCGSIGQAAVQLFLRHNPHPSKLILCDLAANDKLLRQLELLLKDEVGFRGEIVRLHGGDQAPAELYTADVIVGATSQPDVLDVNRLRPGTVVVDDSFPHCFNVHQAIKRMKSKKDVLIIGGGLLSLGHVERTAHLPDGLSKYGNQLLGELPSFGMASCQLEGLMRAAQPALPPTKGLVSEPAIEKYWHAVEEFEFSAAPLHLGNYIVEHDAHNS
ncbi:MAG: hypothetical protein AAGD96_08495, partial [Chloroflexota bacterium]